MLKSIRPIFQTDEFAEARPFYLIITFILLSTVSLTLFEPPNPMTLSRLPLFGLLFAFHLALHWVSSYAASHTQWRIPYLLGQGVLALAQVAIAQHPGLALALFATLVTETLGLFGLTRVPVLGVVGYLGLTAVSYLMLGGPTLLMEWVSPTVSTMTLLIIFIVMYRRQSEARKESQHLLAELAATNRQLADYAAQVESLTLATERQRMARELHDTLAQGVAGLVLQLEAANNHLENGRSPRAQTIIQQSMKRARTTLADARAAIDDLRLEDRSLPEAIQRHADRFTQATGIPCHLTLAVEPGIPETIADHAERIISESLTNITRHAEAHNVWLTVRQEDNQLLITVRDDGVGFDVDKFILSNAEGAVRAGHYGLLGIRERARLVRGEFTVNSAPNEGTQITLRLPLEVQ
ncbi:MAG: sensor histidine kinase [Ardenticatenaceae bacterium]|nr:sensor histidine kinase [Ardenticatenaceae bacterium]